MTVTTGAHTAPKVSTASSKSVTKKAKKPATPEIEVIQQLSAQQAAASKAKQQHHVKPKSSSSKATASAMPHQMYQQQTAQATPFVVGQTTIHPVVGSSSKAKKQQQAEAQARLNESLQNQMATITPKPLPQQTVHSAAANAAASTKSSLRDYRRPAKAKTAVAPSPSGKGGPQTASIAPSTSSGSGKRPGVHANQANNNMAARESEAAHSLATLASVAAAAPSLETGIQQQQQQVYQHNLPKGLTITEIDRSRVRPFAKTEPPVPLVSISQQPVKGVTQSMPQQGQMTFGGKQNRFQQHQQVMPVISIPDPSKLVASRAAARSVQSSTAAKPTGHPGLPNGLLRMATTSYQQNSTPKVATKIVPKDLKSQLALSKLGLSAPPVQQPGSEAKKSGKMSLKPDSGVRVAASPAHLLQPGQISSSMAANAAKAVPKSYSDLLPGLSKPKKYPSVKGPKVNGTGNGSSGSRATSGPSSGFAAGKSGSPNSSRSSSRNSSVSPRERSGSHSKVNNKASLSPGSAKLPGGNIAALNAKRKIFQGPLVPWSKRGKGPAKGANGWSWIGEGTEQKVHFNVSPQKFLSHS